MSSNYKPRRIKRPGVERIYTPAELRIKAAIDARAAKKIYNHIDRAYFHRERSDDVAEVLRAAVHAAHAELNEKDFDVLLALVERMKFCSERANHYIADDLHSEATGETFQGFGHLYPCSSKLCHSCVATFGKRNHKTAAAAIHETKLGRRKYKDYQTGRPAEQQERLRLITLTMPEIKETCLDTLKILGDAWERFRKTDIFKNYVSGFARGTEFTTRKDETYHAHIHLIVASVYLPHAEFKAQWTDCVEKAFHKAGLEFEAATANGYCVVNFRYVGNVDGATRELCKYVTKSDSWSEVPKAHLIEMASIARWPKMFSLGGSFAVTAERQKREAAAKRAAATTTSTNSKRFDASDDSAHDATSAERESYLDTKSVSDGFCIAKTSGELPTADVAEAKRKKKPNWRKLVRQIGRERYLIILAKQVSAQRLYRKLQLREKYPLATITDLTGRTWAQPRTEFIEEYDPATGETIRWSAEQAAAMIYDEDYYLAFG